MGLGVDEVKACCRWLHGWTSVVQGTNPLPCSNLEGLKNKWACRSHGCTTTPKHSSKHPGRPSRQNLSEWYADGVAANAAAGTESSGATKN